MKTLVTLVMLCALWLNVIAQAPEKMSYQAVIRDSGGNLVTNKQVGMRITILEGTLPGSQVYQETQNPTTNANGLVTIEIGGGSGFNTINWGNGLHYLKTETDPAGGTSYTITGTSQLLSVPYALYAKDVLNKNDADADPANEIQVISKTGNVVSLSKSGGTFTDAVDDADANPANELQQLSISGTVLTLTNGGGSVTLPSSGGGDNWGTQVVVTDATLTGNGTTTSPLKIADNGVTSMKIADGAIANGDLADNAVNSAKILDASVGEADLAGNAVTTTKIAPNAVTIAKLPAGAAADKYLRGDGTWAVPVSGITLETDPTWSGVANEMTDIGRLGRVGIGTTTPEAQLHAHGTRTGGGNVLFTGEYKATPGDPPASGTGTRMMWYPDKAAFRVGFVQNKEWDKDSTGHFSIALGLNTKASNYNSTAMGCATTASGWYSTAMGYKTNASSWMSTAIGKYNVGGGDENDWVTSDPLFEIGNGASDAARSNALTILKNGNTGIGTATPTALLQTRGTGTSGGNVMFVGQHKLSTPGDPPASGVGTRMMWYPDKAAFRVGISEGDEWDKSNIGHISIAMGLGTKAYGPQSIALGERTSALGMGSTALGSNTEASGNFSTAMGYDTNATGYGSTTMGESTRSSGTFSAALGFGTKAYAYVSTAIGRWNVGAGDSSSWVLTDPIFEIGNGTSYSTHSNALTVLKNGHIGLQSVTNPTYALELPNSTVVGTGQARAYKWDTYSDGRTKSNRQTIPYGLNEILRLQPVSYFHHNSTIKEGKIIIEPEGSAAIGFIAQDVYKIIPEVVTLPQNEETDLWSMSYEKLTPVLVRAIQELKSENDRLKAEILRMKSDQEARLTKLENLLGTTSDK